MLRLTKPYPGRADENKHREQPSDEIKQVMKMLRGTAHSTKTVSHEQFADKDIHVAIPNWFDVAGHPMDCL